MTFKCCKNCLIDMVCQTPCEKFEVKTLQLVDLSDFNKCLLLMKKYNNKTFKLDKEISVEVLNYTINIYKNDQLHRDNGPAIIDVNGNKKWYKYNQFHREDGPAIIHKNGSKEWWKNGVKIK